MLTFFAALWLIAATPIVSHGDLTVPPDATGVTGTVKLVNRGAAPVALDLRPAQWATGQKVPPPDALVSVDPQTVTIAAYSAGAIKIGIADATFFGTAQLNLAPGNVPGSPPISVSVHRGLIVQTDKLALYYSEPSGFQVENPGNVTISARWLLRTPSGDLCAAADCSSMDHWFGFDAGPHRVTRVAVNPRDWWFRANASQGWLVINYSGTHNGVEQVTPVSLSFQQRSPLESAAAWCGNALAGMQGFFRFLRTLILIAIGALAFWIANVVIANIRQYYATSRRIVDLRSRVEGISSATASRTRASLTLTCESILEAARGHLFSQNNGQQLPMQIDSFERRIGLAERLDAAYIKRNEVRADRNLPLSVARDIDASLAKVEGLVNGDVSPEDLARADKILTSAFALEDAMKALPAQFRMRLEQLQIEFARAQWKQALAQCRDSFPAAISLLETTLDNPETAKVLESNLAARDLDLTQLELLWEIFSVAAPEDKKWEIIRHASFRSEWELQRARSLLNQCKEGIGEDEILNALKYKQWYAYSEPNSVRLGSTLRMWIHFSRGQLNRCAALQGFTCYWNSPDGSFEEGWDVYVVASSLDDIEIRPSFEYTAASTPETIDHIYDEAGKKIPIPTDTRTVSWPSSKSPWIYDLLQVAISLIVPVLTVTLVEYQKDLEIGALALLTVGFTSQLLQTTVLGKVLN